MKRIFLSFAFLLAIGAAFLTQASSPKLVTTYYQAKPGSIPATCEVIDCDLSTNLTCTFVKPLYSTYKSETMEPICNTLITLKRRQQ